MCLNMLFNNKTTKELEKIISLLDSVSYLNQEVVNAMLIKQKKHAEAIYETLRLLKEKGQQNRLQDWITETLYYSPYADCYTLLSSENITLTLENAGLLEMIILPILREKGNFSQQAFNSIMEQAIAENNTTEVNEMTNPLVEEATPLLIKKTM